ncbi:MAG: SHOCT domain-containing protein [Chloroflexi bacterium]|jgi:hypothetical protein|nr:SHOCT domain-containing protein [Chloroflexota bacterium]
METWQLVVGLLIVYVPAIVLWLYCLTKIVRAKRSLAWKAAWAVAILVIPIIGAFFFLLFGHRSAAYEVTSGLGGPDTRGEMTDAEVLGELEQLRAAGKISQEDYEAIRARHAVESPGPTSPSA